MLQAHWFSLIKSSVTIFKLKNFSKFCTSDYIATSLNWKNSSSIKAACCCSRDITHTEPFFVCLSTKYRRQIIVASDIKVVTCCCEVCRYLWFLLFELANFVQKICRDLSLCTSFSVSSVLEFQLFLVLVCQFFKATEIYNLELHGYWSD